MGEMEKRLLLFFGVTFVLVSLWPRMFPAPRPPEPREPPRVVEGVRDVAPESTDPAPDVSVPSPLTGNTEDLALAAAAEDKVAEVAAASERTVVVQTSMYEMKLTNRGARMLSFMLQEYRDNEGRPYEMLRLHE